MESVASDEFGTRVGMLSVGKRIGGVVYLHRDALAQHDGDLFGTVCSFASEAGDTFRWNVCKFSPRRRKVSFLYYPRFRDEEHPVLTAAASLDLNDSTMRVRHYPPNGNRPILHRKELLLDASDPDYTRFAALTDQEERSGLFSAPTTIGHERGWSRQLEERGLMIRGHRLLRVGEADGSTA